MTFQIHVKIGTWYKNDRNYNKDSRVDFWVAEEGKPSIQVLGLDVDLCCGPSYGKMWFTPYNTRKDPNAAHPEAYTWYDDIVVSRTRIAEPALESPAAGVRTTPTSPRAAAKSGLTTVAASARTPTTSSTAAPGNASTSPPL
jgi:hypothetical protein